jgi:hypothetical protein
MFTEQFLFGNVFNHPCPSNYPDTFVFAWGNLTVDTLSRPPNVSLVSSAAATCTPIYKKAPVEISMNLSYFNKINFSDPGPAMNVFLTESSPIIPLTGTLSDRNPPIFEEPDNSPNFNMLNHFSSWFALMVDSNYLPQLVHGGYISFDYTTLDEALIKIFPDLWMNYAHDNLFSSSNKPISGAVITTSNYLVVDARALLGLFTALAILTIIFILIIFTRPKAVDIPSPYSLTSVSAVIPLDKEHKSPPYLTELMGDNDAEKFLHEWNFTIQYRIRQSPVLRWVKVCDCYLVSTAS